MARFTEKEDNTAFENKVVVIVGKIGRCRKTDKTRGNQTTGTQMIARI